MRRRDAVKGFLGLCAASTIRHIAVPADAMIVIEVPYAVSVERAQTMRAPIERLWPGRKVVVIDRGATVRVVEV